MKGIHICFTQYLCSDTTQSKAHGSGYHEKFSAVFHADTLH
jgi:hypothetical protein